MMRKYTKVVVSEQELEDLVRRHTAECEMVSKGKPKPDDYGLSKELLQFFRSSIRKHANLPTVLGLVTLFTFPWLVPTPLRKTYTTLLIASCGLSGLVIGWAINRLREVHHEYSKRKHSQYPKWREYRAARSQWIELFRKDLQQKARELQRQVKRWDWIDGSRFEKEIVGLLKKHGYDVNITSRSSDGGRDMLVRDGTKKIIVQCKRHCDLIGEDEVNEFYEAMVHERADEGWIIITSGYFNPAARYFAKGKPIKLIKSQELIWKSF